MSLFGRNYKFDFFHHPSRSQSKMLHWRRIRCWKFSFWVLVQTSEDSKGANSHDSSQDSNFFLGKYLLDFFYQVLSRKLKTCSKVFFEKHVNLLLDLEFWRSKNSWTCCFYWFFSIFKLDLLQIHFFLRNYRFDFFHRGLYRTLCTCSSWSKWKIVLFYICIRILLSETSKKSY